MARKRLNVGYTIVTWEANGKSGEFYVRLRDNKIVQADEAVAGGAVTESSRTEINESENADRLTELFKELGNMTSKEARLAAGSRKGNGAKSNKKALRETYMSLGLSKREAKILQKRDGR